MYCQSIRKIIIWYILISFVAGIHLLSCIWRAMEGMVV